jgi:protein gp37
MIRTILFCFILFQPGIWTYPITWDPVLSNPPRLSLEGQLPLVLKRPRVWRIPSWEDLLAKENPLELIDAVFGIMMKRPDHLFIVCTENSARLRAEWETFPVGFHIMIIVDNSALHSFPVLKHDFCGRSNGFK